MRRLLVTLDDDGQEELETVARLAARLEAELIGLFRPDPELASAALLPCTRLVPRQRLAGGPEPGLLGRAERMLARAAERRLAEIALRAHVHWSFQSAAVPSTEALLALLGAGDVLGFRPPGRRRPRLRPAGWMSMAAAPVVVVYEGSETALALGDALAREARAALAVLVAPGPGHGEADALAREAGRWLGLHGHGGEVRRLGAGPSAIMRALAERRARLAVLDRLGDEVLAALITSTQDDEAPFMFALR